MNAIILAAGKSTRFAPFTYEKPKGLFRVKGDILIERQIEQLCEAGVEEIFIVVGYMKEKFFYLEQKYPEVHLIINNEFGKKGNLYSLYVAREYLANTFICCADHYFTFNPFLAENPENHSYRACAYYDGKFREFGIKCSDADVITEAHFGGHDSYAMVGHAYMNSKFSAKFRELLESEINDFGIASMFWEEFYASHIQELTFFAKYFSADEIKEFDSIDDLREFDSEFLLNVDSEIITNITNTLDCHPNEITDIRVINAGLTNVSFGFDVNCERYVYRHPGGTAGNLIDRQAELYAQIAAKEIGIDRSVIDISLSGWKVSHYVHNAKNCNFETNESQLIEGMEFLHRLHAMDKPVKLRNGETVTIDTVKIFDNVGEGKKLMHIASATKGNLAREFSDLVIKEERLYEAVKTDAERLGFGLVLCHNDTYEPNYLYDDNGKMFLIDWEYAGMNYAANDIGCILCRYDWNEAQMERYLRYYVGHELNADERRYYYGFLPISAFYWFCWGLYKGSVGDDDSFFFLPSYRNLVKYIDPALESYGLSTEV